MKKSKVIIPAMAVIAFSTAASITGTVAWFTASRSAVITQQNMAVVRIDGTLSTQLVAGIGTRVVQVSGEDQIAPQLDHQTTPEDVKMTNASFNPVAKQLYFRTGTNENPIWSDIGTNTTWQDAASVTNTQYKIPGSDYYYAFTWKVTFSYLFGEDQNDLNIFFDPSASSMAGTADPTDTTHTHTEKGFRLAMIGMGESRTTNTIVYSDTQTTTNFKGVVKGTGTPAYTEVAYGTDPFDDGFTYFGNGDTHTKVNDFDEGQKSDDAYLTCIKYDSTHPTTAQTVDVYFVAWYEGTDINVVNASTLDAVSSRLHFYTAINKVTA